jgi:hypothetical protein
MLGCQGRQVNDHVLPGFDIVDKVQAGIVQPAVGVAIGSQKGCKPGEDLNKGVFGRDWELLGCRKGVEHRVQGGLTWLLVMRSPFSLRADMVIMKEDWNIFCWRRWISV